jgi:hypothetical protein
MLRRKFIAISAYIKKRDLSNKQFSYAPYDPRKTRTNQAQKQKTEIIKIRAEINEIKTKKKTIQRK